MAPPRIQIPPELLERARALYENGTSLDVIGRLIGVSGPTVRNRAVDLGWSRARPARTPEPDTMWPNPPPPMREPSDEDATPRAIVARLGRLIAREMLRTETYDHSPEAAARTLVMLSRSASILSAIHDGAERETAPQEQARPLGPKAACSFIAEVIERLNEIYDDEGEEGLLGRVRSLPELESAIHLVVGDRRRREAEAAAGAP